MKKRDFLSQLESALQNKLEAQEIKEHVSYYETYIEEEIRKGQAEEEVLAMLGDPWAIAKTIVISEEIAGNDSQNYSEDTTAKYSEEKQSVIRTGNFNKIIALIVIGVILLAILSVVFGLLAFVIRYAVPILILIAIVSIWKKK